MSAALFFWVIMVVWLLFGFWSNWPAAGKGTAIGGHIALWVLLALLGWRVFGPMLHQ